MRGTRQSIVLAAITGAALLIGACTGTSSSQVEAKQVDEVRESTTTTEPPDCAEVLSPAAQAGQLLMVMVTAPQLATDVLAAGQAGGFGLKGRQSAEVGDEVAAAIATAPVAPFVASDEEGGTVQRLGKAIGELPSAADLAKGTPEEAAKVIEPYALKMRELGFNMNFGPVADVGSGSDLGSRSFGDEATVVAGFTDAVIGAQQAGGLISVVKHWPGIGGGSSDPHTKLDDVAPIDQLRAAALVPFEAAFRAGVPAVMVAHVVVPGLTAEDEPASLSRAAITDELRGREGFTGLVITDSLGMGAVVNTTPQDEAAERSIAAGADIALVSGADVVPVAHARLTDAITTGRIPNEQVVASVRRVLAAKGVEGPCPELAANLATIQQNTATSLPTGDGDVDTGINGEDASVTSTTGGGSSKSSTTSAPRSSTTAPRSSTTVPVTTTTAEPTTTTEADPDPGQADVVQPD